jgi:hypothetical protein
VSSKAVSPFTSSRRTNRFQTMAQLNHFFSSVIIHTSHFFLFVA